MTLRIAVDPAPGVNSDDSPFSQQMRITDANHVRFQGGRAQPAGGWVKEFADALTGKCRNALAWRDNNGSVNIAFGTHTGLFVYVNGELHDITPAGLSAGAEDSAMGPGFGTGDFGEGEYGIGDSSSYFARTWSLQAWGQWLLANPRGDTIYVWQGDTSQPAEAIANAPDQVNTILVTPDQQVLALGCNEELSGTFNPRCIRGCALEDYDDWATSLEGDSWAFEHILEPAGGGRIVNGRMIGPYVAVWTDQGVFVGEFVATELTAYRFDVVDTGCGLAGPNAAEVLDRRAWWMTPEHTFYTWTPGEAPALVPCPIRDDMKNNVAAGQDDKIVACSVGQFGEVWWFYPDARDGLENSRAMFVKIDGANLLWSRSRLARTAAIDAGSQQFPLFVSPAGEAFAHESGQSANGAPLTWSMTIALPYLDEGGRAVLLNGMEPDIKDQVGPVLLSFALREYAQGPARNHGPFTLAPGLAQRHFQMEGNIAELTFAGNSSPSFARMGKNVLLAVPAGGR